jgi:hypothetical protein
MSGSDALLMAGKAGTGGQVPDACQQAGSRASGAMDVEGQRGVAGVLGEPRAGSGSKSVDMLAAL